MTKRPMLLATLAGLALGAGLALTGCDSGPVVGPAEGMTAPDLSGSDPAARPVRLSDYKGKVVLLDFWAVWCKPCVNMIPHTKELLARHEGKPFAVVGVSQDRDPLKVQRFIEDKGIPWPNALDASGAISAEWKVDSLPTLFVIDKKGVIRNKFVGKPPDKDIEDAIESLLAE
jgi:peroxiredoxin